MNSVLKGLRERRLDNIHWEIWFTTLNSCGSKVEIELGEKDMKNWSHLGVICTEMMACFNVSYSVSGAFIHPFAW